MPEKTPSIQVGQIVNQGEFKISRVYHERWLGKLILHPRPQRPGLALAGYLKYINTDRIQVFGKTEIGYLNQLAREERQKRLERYMALRIPAIVISESMETEDSFIRLGERFRTSILISDLRTSLLLSRMTSHLYRFFSRGVRLNGVLMDIMGQGVMICGDSGIGKSETALELINKGYHVVADDAIDFSLDPNDELVGRASEPIRNLIEVRGLGIINVNDIFGSSAVLQEVKLSLVIMLEKWDSKKQYDRLGEDNLYFKIMGVDVPMLILPVAPGRNVSTLIEVAVRYFLAKKSGKLTFLELLDRKKEDGEMVLPEKEGQT